MKNISHVTEFIFSGFPRTMHAALIFNLLLSFLHQAIQKVAMLPTKTTTPASTTKLTTAKPPRMGWVDTLIGLFFVDLLNGIWYLILEMITSIPRMNR